MSRPNGGYVNPTVHAQVRQRDGQCMAAAKGFAHVCRDAWGNAHAPDEIEKLTCEHLWRDYAQKGRRPPSTPQFLVAVCYWINAEFHPSKAMRGAFRLYLDDLYGPLA